MTNKRRSLIAVLFLAVLLPLVSCSTTPTSFDRAIATITTNQVPTLVLQTNLVTLYQTNTQVQTITVTNVQGLIVPIFVTNITTLATTQTNVVVITNMVPTYTATASPAATGVATGIGDVVGALVPGTGGLVTSGLLGVLSIFLGIRNRQFAGKTDALSQAAGTLAQIIETGREVLSKTPQGQQAANAFTQWMVTHQADTNTIAQITQIVKDSTNNAEAQSAADQILALVGQAPTPTPPAPKT